MGTFSLQSLPYNNCCSILGHYILLFGVGGLYQQSLFSVGELAVTQSTFHMALKKLAVNEMKPEFAAPFAFAMMSSAMSITA